MAGVYTLPGQPQPYGLLFLVQIDGTGLMRLTHNGWEDGTPTWGPPLDIDPHRATAAEEAREY